MLPHFIGASAENSGTVSAILHELGDAGDLILVPGEDAVSAAANSERVGVGDPGPLWN